MRAFFKGVSNPEEEWTGFRAFAIVATRPPERLSLARHPAAMNCNPFMLPFSPRGLA